MESLGQLTLTLRSQADSQCSYHDRRRRTFRRYLLDDREKEALPMSTVCNSLGTGCFSHRSFLDTRALQVLACNVPALRGGSW